MSSKILLVGATGLVGQGVLKVLLQASPVCQVTVLVRRPFPVEHPRIRVMQIPDFSTSFLEQLDLSGIDACFYCAGPLPVLLSESTYRAATVGVLEHVAAAYAKSNPHGYLIYISGMGANPGSRWMPLRVKGLAEATLCRFGLAFTCLRPGVIRPTQGERSPHPVRRVLYMLSAPALALAERLMPGVITSTDAVGRCMVQLTQAPMPHPPIVENRQINELASK